MLRSGRLITMNSSMARGEEEQKPKKNKDKNKKDKKDKKVQGLFAGCWHPLAFAAHILSIPRIERRIIMFAKQIEELSSNSWCLHVYHVLQVRTHSVDNLPRSVFGT